MCGRHVCARGGAFEKDPLRMKLSRGTVPSKVRFAPSMLDMVWVDPRTSSGVHLSGQIKCVIGCLWPSGLAEWDGGLELQFLYPIIGNIVLVAIAAGHLEIVLSPEE